MFPAPSEDLMGPLRYIWPFPAIKSKSQNCSCNLERTPDGSSAWTNRNRLVCALPHFITRVMYPACLVVAPVGNGDPHVLNPC